MFIEVSTEYQIEIVESLAREIWTEHYIPIIGKEQVDYMLASVPVQAGHPGADKDRDRLLSDQEDDATSDIWPSSRRAGNYF